MTWNPIGLRTLFLKELRRFSKVWMQTVFSPMVTTSLYFVVFGMALGTRISSVVVSDEVEVPYMRFVVPGLMMLGMITNSFLNSSSSLFQSKINGTLPDMLVAPLGAAEIALAYVGAAMVRGAVVGVLVYAVAGLFTGFSVAAPIVVVLFGLGACVAFALFGLAAAIWAEKFDHLSIFPNFVLTPLTFLGGVFYSVDMLPEPWSTVSHANPILYVVAGLRHGLLGGAEVPLLSCALALATTILVALATVWWMLASGYKLRR